jgi:putative tricarboxylic transport membrane protein
VFDLRGGFALIPVLIGAYGIPEVFNAVRKQEHFVITTALGRVLPRFRAVFAHWRHIVRSGVIGTFIGIIPGVGSDLASWISYDTARRTSRHPEEFGKGSVEGLIAAEGGDNACIGGDIVPVLTLAIPGSAPAAVLLAALTIHGLQPGPLMVLQHPASIGQVFAMGLVATAAVFVLSLVLVRQMVKILLIPRTVLMPIVFIIAMVGSYALSGRLFDVYVMAAFGVIGLAMQELGYPVAPFVLGFILGPMMEDNFRRGLELAGGSALPFFTRPISTVLIVLTLLSVLSSTPLPKWVRRQVGMLRPATEAQ